MMLFPRKRLFSGALLRLQSLVSDSWLGVLSGSVLGDSCAPPTLSQAPVFERGR